MPPIDHKMTLPPEFGLLEYSMASGAGVNYPAVQIV